MKRVTGEDLYNFSKCKYRVAQDATANRDESDTVDPFLDILWRGGQGYPKETLEHFIQQRKLAHVDVPRTNDENDDATAGSARETSLHMKAGAGLIENGVLVRRGEDSLFSREPMLVGRPDALVRIKGASSFGAYSYAPLIIKAGSGRDETDWGERPNAGYTAELTFYATLLEDLLGSPVTEGYVLNAQAEPVRYILSTKDRSFNETLTEIRRMSLGENTGREPVISSVCGICHWQSLCQRQAEKKGDPTLLFYLGEKVKYGFYELGIRNLSELAAADIAKLLPKVERAKRAGFFYPSMTDELLKRLVTRAQLYLQEKAEGNKETYIIRKDPNFPATQKEIHYDIEDDPLTGVVYMHGFWIIDEGKAPHYHAIITGRDRDEKDISKELWSFFASHEGVPIYHYSAHEKQTCKKLMDRHGLSGDVYDRIFGPRGSAIDLYQWIVDNTDWPLTSYGLKPIAKYTGFSWSAEDAGGANSVSWYYAYLEGDDAMMEKIMTYNKEDCMATAHLKKWLQEHA